MERARAACESKRGRLALALTASLGVHGALLVAAVLGLRKPPEEVPITLVLNEGSGATRAGGAAGSGRPATRQPRLARRPGRAPPREKGARPQVPAAPRRIVGMALEATSRSRSGANAEARGRATAGAGGDGSGAGDGTARGGAETGEGVTPPRRTRSAKPRYPELLRARGIEADVELLVSIDPAGKVTAVEVVRGAPEPAFNQAARDAAWRESYRPAERDGAPVPYRLKFTTRFRLEEP